jgi:hypothetical protein
MAPTRVSSSGLHLERRLQSLSFIRYRVTKVQARYMNL